MRTEEEEEAWRRKGREEERTREAKGNERKKETARAASVAAAAAPSSPFSSLVLRSRRNPRAARGQMKAQEEFFLHPSLLGRKEQAEGGRSPGGTSVFSSLVPLGEKTPRRRPASFFFAAALSTTLARKKRGDLFSAFVSSTMHALAPPLMVCSQARWSCN